MSFSDEPNLVRTSSWNARKLAAAAVVMVFVGLIMAAMLQDPIHEWRRRNRTVGKHHGTVHTIKVAGTAHELEIGFIQQNLVVWTDQAFPDDAKLRLRSGSFEEVMEYFPQGKYFGPTRATFSTVDDYKFDLAIEIGGQVVWEGSRWSYGTPLHTH